MSVSNNSYNYLEEIEENQYENDESYYNNKKSDIESSKNNNLLKLNTKNSNKEYFNIIMNDNENEIFIYYSKIIAFSDKINYIINNYNIFNLKSFYYLKLIYICKKYNLNEKLIDTVSDNIKLSSSDNNKNKHLTNNHIKIKPKVNNIDIDLINSSSFINLKIMQNIQYKQKTKYLLNFLFKLYKPYIKKILLNDKTSLYLIFDYWRNIIVEEKMKVNNAIENLNICAEDLIDKINNYDLYNIELQDKIKKINLLSIDCSKCNKLNNSNAVAKNFSDTYTAIKEETLNNINSIPNLNIHYGFINNNNFDCLHDNDVFLPQSISNKTNKDIKTNYIKSPNKNNGIIHSKNIKQIKNNNSNNYYDNLSECCEDNEDIEEGYIVDINTIARNIDVKKISKLFYT